MSFTRNYTKDQMRKIAWHAYAASQPGGVAPDQTTRFFDRIPPTLKSNFTTSSNVILQLGVASGKYLADSQISKNRKCIGYDFIPMAVQLSRENHIDAKLVDLNSVNNNELTYQHQLEADLSVPTDILAIRLFEYLDRESTILLIFALIDKATPNSIFYIETCLEDNDFINRIGHKFGNGYVASFFGPRTDFKFIHSSVDREHPECENDTGTYNQLIVQKL